MTDVADFTQDASARYSDMARPCTDQRAISLETSWRKVYCYHLSI